MMLTLLLMALMATIGSFDGLYYHIYRFRLFDQPASRAETVTHLLRGLSFAAAVLVISAGRPEGAWYWAIAALFGADLLIDVVDVLIEPSSRKPLGGLPGPEYLIHMVVMAISGGIWVSFLVNAWQWRNHATALVPYASNEMPTWLIWDGRLMGAGALGLVLLEGGMMLRSVLRNGPTLPAGHGVAG